MKTISIFLALVNSLLAGLLIAYSLSGSEIRQAAVWWSLTKVLAGLSVITIGALMWFGTIGSIRPGLMALGSLSLVALGAACERLFGPGQDIEWAFSGGKPWLLQSRPITT